MMGAKSKDPGDISFAMTRQGVLTIHGRLDFEPEATSLVVTLQIRIEPTYKGSDK